MVTSTRSDTITNKDLTWINIENPTRESMREILRHGYHFHELSIEDTLSKIQIPKIDRYRDYIFVILYFPTTTNTTSSPHHSHSPPQRDSSIAVITSRSTRKRKHSDGSSSISSLHLSQLSIFAGKNFLVTVHQGDLQPLNELFYECKEGDSGKRDEIMGKISGYLLHTIIDVLVDDLFHLLMKIVGNLQDIEEAVYLF
jgi:magnesium transporter